MGSRRRTVTRNVSVRGVCISRGMVGSRIRTGTRRRSTSRWRTAVRRRARTRCRRVMRSRRRWTMRLRYLQVLTVARYRSVGDMSWSTGTHGCSNRDAARRRRLALSSGPGRGVVRRLMVGRHRAGNGGWCERHRKADLRGLKVGQKLWNCAALS